MSDVPLCVNNGAPEKYKSKIAPAFTVQKPVIVTSQEIVILFPVAVARFTVEAEALEAQGA